MNLFSLKIDETISFDTKIFFFDQTYQIKPYPHLQRQNKTFQEITVNLHVQEKLKTRCIMKWQLWWKQLNPHARNCRFNYYLLGTLARKTMHLKLIAYSVFFFSKRNKFYLHILYFEMRMNDIGKCHKLYK